MISGIKYLDMKNPSKVKKFLDDFVRSQTMINLALVLYLF